MPMTTGADSGLRHAGKLSGADLTLWSSPTKAIAQGRQRMSARTSDAESHMTVIAAVSLVVVAIAFLAFMIFVGGLMIKMMLTRFRR